MAIPVIRLLRKRLFFFRYSAVRGRTQLRQAGCTDKRTAGAGAAFPVIRDYVLGGVVPKPCKWFCGRSAELEQLHTLLEAESKVFLYGIAGIGKSELAKAYAAQYRKEYTNILYLTYSGDLMQDITDMDFVDDLPTLSPKERFRRHNQFLRSLKEDTLFIIDNFNTTGNAGQFSFGRAEISLSYSIYDPQQDCWAQ